MTRASKVTNGFGSGQTKRTAVPPITGRRGRLTLTDGECTVGGKGVSRDLQGCQDSDLEISPGHRNRGQEWFDTW